MPPRHRSRYDSEDDFRWTRTPRRSRNTSSSRYAEEDRSIYPPDPEPLNEPRSYSQYSRSSGESQRDTVEVEVDEDVQRGQRVYHQTGINPSQRTFVENSNRAQPTHNRTGHTDSTTRVYTQPDLAYRPKPGPSVEIPTFRSRRYPIDSTQYERRAPTPSLVELTGHQPGPPGNLPQYSYPAEFQSPSLATRPLDTGIQQSSFNPLFSSSIQSNPLSLHNKRDTELVMFQRDMGIAADPRDQTVIFSRSKFHYPDEDALLFTSPVHFPIVDERGNVGHYKVCEHVTDNGDPNQCKAFHTPVHTSTVSIGEIHPEDLHFYSAAIIPRNHRMFTDHPSTSRMITVDHSVTYKQVANQYNSQQLAFARRYKDWINSDSGRLRLSQERYITDMKDNIRTRDEVLRERKRELEKKITSGDVMSTLQDGLK
ncbi:uncharacterized protein L199_000853 [Kwoniella botswanensis]|uniref:uncharacterized protein n=1 Tax=Kwoniella botswanensis TaxID=1268659 RepID=UPI00315C9023